MADPEHLEVLREGIEKWNKWREENGSISPDLREADLSEADLREVHLSRADLSGAILSRAILRRAHLREAECEQADFSEAMLAEAGLIATNLNRATITGACLWETQRAGWRIKGVVCECIYWDRERQEVTTFGPGEFERLYAEKVKVLVKYPNGISTAEIVTLPALIQHLEASRPGCKLRFESIQDAPGGAVVTIVVEDVDDIPPEQVEQLRVSIQPEAEQKAQLLRHAQKLPRTRPYTACHAQRTPRNRTGSATSA